MSGLMWRALLPLPLLCCVLWALSGSPTASRSLQASLLDESDVIETGPFAHLMRPDEMQPIYMPLVAF